MACSDRVEGFKPLSADQLCVTVNLVANVCLGHQYGHRRMSELRDIGRYHLSHALATHAGAIGWGHQMEHFRDQH